jgi:GT2 family glycosyltransferase
MPDTRRVACVVLTWNQRETTLRFLASLAAARGASDPAVLFFDQGSEDGTQEAIHERFPDVHVHWNPKNLGVASGRNAGAALAMERFDPDLLVFLDNDLVLLEGFFDALLAPFASDPQLGQTQAKLRFLDDPERLNDGGGCAIRWWRGETLPVGFGELDRGQRDTPTPCVSCGGAMAVRAALFRELSGFDSVFDPVGPEDLDFSLRLQARGHRALYMPQAVALHAVNHSFGGGAYTEAYAQHKARNWLVFMMRHARLHQKLAFFAFGAPWLALRAAARELRSGNLGALRGWLRGLLELARTSR